MKKTETFYTRPCVRVKEMMEEPLLGGNTETLPADNDDETEEALSKEGSVWEKEYWEWKTKRCPPNLPWGRKKWKVKSEKFATAQN